MTEKNVVPSSHTTDLRAALVRSEDPSVVKIASLTPGWFHGEPTRESKFPSYIWNPNPRKTFISIISLNIKSVVNFGF